MLLPTSFISVGCICWVLEDTFPSAIASWSRKQSQLVRFHSKTRTIFSFFHFFHFFHFVSGRFQSAVATIELFCQRSMNIGRVSKKICLIYQTLKKKRTPKQQKNGCGTEDGGGRRRTEGPGMEGGRQQLSIFLVVVPFWRPFLFVGGVCRCFHHAALVSHFSFFFLLSWAFAGRDYFRRAPVTSHTAHHVTRPTSNQGIGRSLPTNK